MFVAEIRACGHESDSHTWGGGGTPTQVTAMTERFFWV